MQPDGHAACIRKRRARRSTPTLDCQGGEPLKETTSQVLLCGRSWRAYAMALANKASEVPRLKAVPAQASRCCATRGRKAAGLNLGYSRLPITRVLFPRAHSAMRRGGWREHAALRWAAYVDGQSNQPLNPTVTPLACASVAPAG